MERNNKESSNKESNNKVDVKTPKTASAFVFGSSTPRALNQELPSLESIGSGSSRSTNPASLSSVPPVLYRVRQQPVNNMNSPAEEKTPFVRRLRPMSAYACLSSVDQRMCKLIEFLQIFFTAIHFMVDWIESESEKCSLDTYLIHNNIHDTDTY